MKNIKHHFYPDSKQTSSTQNFKSNLILMYVTFQLYTCNWNLQHRLATILRISAFSWSLPWIDTLAQAPRHQYTKALPLRAWQQKWPDPQFCLILALLWQQTKPARSPISTEEIWGGAGELTVLTSYLDTLMKAFTFLLLFYFSPGS